MGLNMVSRHEIGTLAGAKTITNVHPHNGVILIFSYPAQLSIRPCPERRIMAVFPVPTELFWQWQSSELQAGPRSEYSNTKLSMSNICEEFEQGPDPELRTETIHSPTQWRFLFTVLGFIHFLPMFPKAPIKHCTFNQSKSILKRLLHVFLRGQKWPIT